MTVATTARKAILAGNGINTNFGFNFAVRAAADLQVYYTDAAGIQTLLAANLYSVALNPVPNGQLWAQGGSVTYPLAGAAIAAGTQLTIARNVPLTQTSTLINQGGYSPQTVEQALDLLDMAMQQLNEIIGRSLTIPISSSANTAMPVPVGNALLGWDATGANIINVAAAGAIPLPLGAAQGGTGAANTSAKGSILTGRAGTYQAKLVAADGGQFLIPDSTQADGLKWTPNPGQTVQALVDAANVAWNMDAGPVATLLATNAIGNTRAMAAPTNIKAGQRYVLHYTQDATGGRALTFNAVFKGANGAAMPAVVPTTGTTTSLAFDSPDGVNLILVWSRIGNVQVFSASGTYTPTQGMRWCKVTVVGGGGGSGSASAGAGAIAAAGGGGGGGMAVKTISAATVAASQTVTVGAGGAAGAGSNGGSGGTSSFGAIVSATGGAGGVQGPSGAGSTAAGVAAGVGSSGDVNTSGDAGGASLAFTSTQIANGGKGGSSPLGGGAPARQSTGAGVAGLAFGGGASGAISLNADGGFGGAAGAAGVVIVEEFF